MSRTFVVTVAPNFFTVDSHSFTMWSDALKHLQTAITDEVRPVGTFTSVFAPRKGLTRTEYLALRSQYEVLNSCKLQHLSYNMSVKRWVVRIQKTFTGSYLTLEEAVIAHPTCKRAKT